MTANTPSGILITTQCQKCGAVFPSVFGRMFKVFGEGSLNVSMYENMEDCIVPGYGGMTKMASAAYRFSEYGAEVFSGQQTTKEMLYALRVVLERARSGDIGLQELQSEVESISPAFASLFDFFKFYPEVSAALITSFVTIMLYVLTFLIDDDEPVSIEQNFYGPVLMTPKGHLEKPWSAPTRAFVNQ